MSNINELRLSRKILEAVADELGDQLAPAEMSEVQNALTTCKNQLRAAGEPVEEKQAQEIGTVNDALSALRMSLNAAGINIG